MTKGTALVTGGALRLGRAIALALAENGYDIALHYHTSAEHAENVVFEIEKNNRKCHLFRFDFTQSNNAASWLEEVFARCPDCNVLINSASIFERGSFLATDTNLFDRHMSINFKTPFFLSQAFARLCKQGDIINILDTKITATRSEHFIYTLTKKLFYEFTLMAAATLAPAIRVNGVSPGLILPPPGKDESYLAEKSTDIPLQRYGEPEHIVSAVLFLLANPFIVGECIFVDGGEHLQ